MGSYDWRVLTLPLFFILPPIIQRSGLVPASYPAAVLTLKLQVLHFSPPRRK